MPGRRLWRARAPARGENDRRRSQMGRHASHRAPGRARSGLAGRPVLLGGLAVLLVAVLAVGLVWFTSRGEAAGAGAAGRTRQQTVRVTVAPEVESLARELLAEPAPLDGDSCAVAE